MKQKNFSHFLPQFYPTPENDNWGKGFTDLDSTKNAKPLFKNHHNHTNRYLMENINYQKKMI